MFIVRAYQSADWDFLLKMLMEAAHAPREERPDPQVALQEPRIRQWIEGFGNRRGDIGVIAFRDGEKVGAAWCRLFAADTIVGQVGYVSDETPALAIAVELSVRNSGVGTLLLNELKQRASEAGYSSISLCVGESNPALRFYQRLGFEIVSQTGSLLTMKVELTPPPVRSGSGRYPLRSDDARRV